MSRTATFILVLLLFLSAAGTCLAGGLEVDGLGVRYGTNDGTDKKTNLRRYDVFGVFSLPWSRQLGVGLNLETQFIASVGMLDGDGDAGFIGTLVPGIRFIDRNKRYSLELSAGVALIPDYRMGAEDFGGPLQFIIDGALSVRLYRHLGLGYRFQHFSDADLFGSDNRGVDMHIFEVSYRFLRP